MTRKFREKRRDLDPIQRFVAQNYAYGEFAHIETPDEVDTIGDGLFGFLITELSVAEGCDSKEETLRRLDNIRDQLAHLRKAIDFKLAIAPHFDKKRHEQNATK